MEVPHTPVHALAHGWTALIVAAERPCLLSPRDGAALRLVAQQERLSPLQLEQLVQQLLEQPYNQQLLQEICSNPSPSLQTSKKRLLRHVAAWLRGSCYLLAGNSKQALSDARTAMAYAPPSALSPVKQSAQPPAASRVAGSGAVLPTAAARAAQAVGQSAVQPNTTSSSSKDQQSIRKPTCSWCPALLLAGEAFAALGDHNQAVVHLAQAQLWAPPYIAPVVSTALQAATRCLQPGAAYAWATGGLDGLLQHMQDEAELRLPEVLRPRPKWYYYNAYMTQRIHLTLLEYQLAALGSASGCNSMITGATSTGSSSSNAAGTTGTAISSSSSGRRTAFSSTSTSSSRGRLLLSLMAEGGREAPAVAAAAAAAGFVACTSNSAPTPRLLAAAAGPAGADAGAADELNSSGMQKAAITVQAGSTPALAAADRDDSISSSSSSSRQDVRDTAKAYDGSGCPASGVGVAGAALQLPEVVLRKLLSMDAGELDLMVSHPVALQAQVYELLDVLEEQGPTAVEAHAIQPLTWQEMQGLAGPGVVGLPLGYSATTTLLPPAADPLPLPAPAPRAADTQAHVAAAAAAAVHSPTSAAATMTGVQAEQEVAPVCGGPGHMMSVAGEQVCQAGSSMLAAGGQGWRRPGWRRAQYVLQAVAANQAHMCV